MESKHTPGPWKPLSSMDGHVEAECGLIAKAYRYSIDSDELPVEANARLIAAAPEMLEALRALIEPTYSRKTAERKARAAIAKATGGQQ